MNIEKIKNQFTLFIVLAVYLMSSNFASATSTTPLELNMSLPQHYNETDFEVDYHALVNGANYVMKGSPFVYGGHTYVPIRDISKIFNIDVTYNVLDRIVFLSDKEKDIIIAPRMNLYSDYRGAMIKHGDETVIEAGVDKEYLLVNDRSYLPLRFITETFGYKVDYDPSNKYISIKGSRFQDTLTPTFSDEQQAVITAISEYEAQSTLSVKGTTYFLGEYKEIEATITRKHTNNQLIETITVNEHNGKQYKATRQATQTGRSVGVSEISSDGREEVINLFPFAGQHPYIELTNLRLYGLTKYSQMTIEKEQETADIITYKITELNGEKLHIVVSIQKDKGRLVHYTEKTEYTHKSLDFVGY